MPYVRRGNGRERAESLRMVVRLSYYKTLRAETGRPYFVLVQRGFPNVAVEVDRSKADLKRSILVVRSGRISFSRWCRSIRKRAQSKPSRS